MGQAGGSSRELSDSAEDDLGSRGVGLEAKMDAVVKAVVHKQLETTQSDEAALPKGKGTDFMVESLHTKVDKCMRVLSDVVEKLQETNKVIKQLQRAEAKSEREEEKNKKEEMIKLHSARFSTAGAIKALTADTAAGGSGDGGVKRSERTPVLPPSTVKVTPEKPKPPEPDEKYGWARDMLLVGDTFWRAFVRTNDIKAETDEMSKAVGFRMGAVKEQFWIHDAIDDRGIVKFPLPQRFKTVALSIGATDLLDPSAGLKTLEEGPISEVRECNARILHKRAHLVRRLSEKLMGLGRSVVVVIPPFGKHRKEVFIHWREIVMKQCEDLDLPNFRFLDLQTLMTSTTQTQFKDAQDMLDNWFKDQGKLQLSDFGTRRLFDALKRCMWAKNRKSLLTLNFLKEQGPPGPVPECLRCTWTHPGGPDKCRSNDRLCRRCGIVGHTQHLHSVIDMNQRKRIVEFLGVDIYSDSILHQKDMNVGVFTEVVTNGKASNSSAAAADIGPMTEKEMSESTAAVNYDPDKVQSFTSDWYH